MQKFETVDAYINSFPEDVKRSLVRLRKTIREIVPTSVESMSYGIPTYKLNGKPLVYFAGYNSHIGFYPTPNGMKEFEKELAPYKSGNGTAQFSWDKPLPLELIKKIVKFRLKALSK